jgi:hypothetical protein
MFRNRDCHFSGILAHMFEFVFKFGTVCSVTTSSCPAPRPNTDFEFDRRMRGAVRASHVMRMSYVCECACGLRLCLVCACMCNLLAHSYPRATPSVRGPPGCERGGMRTARMKGVSRIRLQNMCNPADSARMKTLARRVLATCRL